MENQLSTFLFSFVLILQLFYIACFSSNKVAVKHVKGGDCWKIILKLTSCVAIGDIVFNHALLHVFDNEGSHSLFLILWFYRN